MGQAGTEVARVRGAGQVLDVDEEMQLVAVGGTRELLLVVTVCEQVGEQRHQGTLGSDRTRREGDEDAR